MKKNIYFFCAAFIILLNPILKAQPTDLFISEYVEGSSFNKAIELYNGTNAAIDLASGQYVLESYFNGSTSSTTLALTGTIVPGGVFIIAHAQATLFVTPDMTSSSVINFNGDDAVVLRKGGATGTILDVIGQVGYDPGTQWGSNDTCTLNRTMRRKITICTGDITTTNTFYTSPEWDGYSQDVFGGLGTHSTTCSSTVITVAGMQLSPASLSFTTLANVASPTKTYAITGNTLTAPVVVNAPLYFELSLSGTGPFSSSLSIPSSSFTTAPVIVYVRYNPIAVGTDSGTAAHTSSSYTATLNLSGVAIALTSIAQIQGTASASTYTGQVVATQGIVTADFQGTNELGGFFIQDAVGDSNPLTSEGIFIFNTSFPVSVGDFVTLSGTVEEYFNKTQIKSLTSLSIQSTTTTITPVTVSLPFATMTEAEKWEGMRVQFTQTLSVTEVYTLARYGEVSLSLNGRLTNPTNFVDPNDNPASGTSSTGTSNAAAVLAQQDLNNRSRILLDDHSSVQNPAVVPYVDAVDNTLRCGSTLTNLDGIMDYDFGVYRIQPVQTPSFTYAARPSVPSVGVHNVKASSFNVLNYFNGNGSGGGFPTSRGANTLVEFTRQRTKIIEAIKQIDADVLGLMEMENDGNSAQSAIQDLVDGLNTSIGSVTYTFVIDPTTSNGGTGTDEIKVAMIYKPSVLTPTGSSLADNSAVHNRPPLAQTFVHNNTLEKFSVLVNHFKSKGCTGSSGANTDQNDGQGCFNDARKNQASALLTFINTVKTSSGDNDVLVIGDLNAYEQEDPIDILIAGGLNPLLTNAYSYVFDGQSGSLDHALASTPLLAQVTGTTKWHINADEPIGKDYNQEFNPAYMYDSGPFRSSDHDPVIIGLFLQPVISLSVTATSSVSCFGSSTGAATITAVGREGALSYSWTPSGGNTVTATGLSAGLYTISATDGTNIATKTLSIIQPSSVVTASIASQTSLTCNGGNTGSAVLTASGGTGSFTYSWSPAGGNGSTATSLSAAIYTVTVKDANLCSVTKTVGIIEPSAITVSVVGSSSVSCNGLANGTSTVSANGGTGGYTYSWSPTGGSAASASSLTAGIYSVMVKDANLCSATQTLSITQPASISLAVVGTSSILCNGQSNGTSTVSANGGTGGFTYSWSPTGGSAASASALSAGIYSVTVKDANLCSATQTLSIMQPASISLSLIGTSSVSCNGLSNGSATVSANGGTGGFTYSWSPTGGSAASASSLPTGMYSVTVKDANLCASIQTLTILQPAAINITPVGASNVSCNGLSNGSATISASGGTGNFTYSWSPIGGGAASSSSLPAGVYAVNVKDGNSCSATHTVNITQPAPIDISTSVNGLVIQANAANSTYQWINCTTNNSSVSGATSQSFTPQANGSYAVIITTNNCSDTSACKTIVLTGITSDVLDKAYAIYPNPVNNLLTIASDGKGPELVTIYNNLGQVVYTSTGSNEKISVDMTNQPNGIYFVVLKSGEKSVTKKIIKTN
ncbi:hypothetical protein CNR22_16935 [Sphingobacteriaceae bacterium]|nr:hypothetical protein CNR22_16935 [Sphingobacteriaceae bacterium]